MPIALSRPARKVCESMFGTYCNSAIAASTRALTCAETYRSPLITLDTVFPLTPASAPDLAHGAHVEVLLRWIATAMSPVTVAHGLGMSPMTVLLIGSSAPVDRTLRRDGPGLGSIDGTTTSP